MDELLLVDGPVVGALLDVEVDGAVRPKTFLILRR